MKCVGHCTVSPLFWMDARAENAETLKVPQSAHLKPENEE